MKKMISALICTALSGLVCQAQQLPDWMVLRLSGGINLSKEIFSEGHQDEFGQSVGGATYNPKGHFGFQGSLGLGIKLSEKCVLMIEPTLIQQGVKYDSDETFLLEVEDPKTGQTIQVQAFPKWDVDITSVHVPIMTQWQLGDQMGLIAGVGLSPNFSFKGKSNVTIETQTKTYPGASDDLKFGKGRTDDFDNFDLSLIFSPSLFFDLDDEGTKRLTLGVRWDMGLRDMYTQARKDFLAGEGIDIIGTRKQRSTMFTIGFEIRPVW